MIARRGLNADRLVRAGLLMLIVGDLGGVSGALWGLIAPAPLPMLFAASTALVSAASLIRLGSTIAPSHGDEPEVGAGGS